MFATGCQRDYMSSDLLFQPKRISSDSKKGYHQKQSHTKPNIGCLGSLANAKVLGCLRLESSLLWLVNLPATTELGVLLPCHPNPADRWPRLHCSQYLTDQGILAFPVCWTIEKGFVKILIFVPFCICSLAGSRSITHVYSLGESWS